MLSIHDLRVDYDDFCAVHDLSLEVGPGEVCGLIGPNGAGKTSTMRTILGLIEPTYGEIRILGASLQEDHELVGRAVGFMPDFPPVYEDLKVWEFLDLFASSYRIPRPLRKDVVERHLDLVGLTEKRDAAVTGLSRGMRQRMMLAKTLIPDPAVLLLDEPASGVDPQGRIDLKNILKKVSAEGKAVLISSHILAEMNEFCTSVAIMERGRLVVGGRIEEVNRRIMGDAVISVEVLSGADAFRRVIAEDGHAAELHAKEGGVFEFRYRGDAEAAGELLARLIGAGVRISSFSRRKDNLEELFLKVGAKELS
ncbi:ABC transporter ATP-binding protein [Paludisphaera rhizosphaerae]|uniref:ABC transporter ATP-binding protein n=1 Tax=Paludisphaera rhizosphaerae TaxID=2711216 RepID=UPI0013EA16FE|nr:ABC transporter ATP-binding protein [Paludisphaera rhizosphaerae]